MKIGPFGIVEIIIILVVILIIFGPKNLPKLGTAIGKTVKNLREGLGGGKKKEAEEAAKQAEGKEPEELEVVDKPEPGQKKADVAAAEAEAEQNTTTSDAIFEETEPEKDKAE